MHENKTPLVESLPESPTATEEEDLAIPLVEDVSPIPVEENLESMELDNKNEHIDNNIDVEYIPKTPSTAERRKVFENNTKENEPEDNFDAVDQTTNFERASLQRSSIAERRKMYERSQSVQETTTTIIEKSSGSPVMLRRKDSFKNRKNVDDVLKDDNNRKSSQVSKQLSLDHQAGKKNENFASAPTPKRTSTVFGKLKFIS